MTNLGIIPGWAATLSILAFAAGGVGDGPVSMTTDGDDPEERIVFFSTRDGNDEIYVIRPDGTDLRRLTSKDADDGAPAWSPDGTRIAFTSDRQDSRSGQCSPKCRDQIYVMNADGSGQRPLTDHPGGDYRPDWTDRAPHYQEPH